MRTSGFRELNSIGGSHEEMLSFSCKQFRLIRSLLRFLSLWRPPSACFLEVFIYPFVVNIMLLSAGITRNIIQATSKPTWLSIQTVYAVHEVWIWLGHILGNLYFRSRDIETNVLYPCQPLPGKMKSLKKKLKFLNAAVIVSVVTFSLMLCTLYIVSQLSWNEGSKRFSSDLPGIRGTLDHILYVIVIISIVYNLGIGLALAWIMALLFVCFACRLKALEGILLKWRRSTEDAVYFFQLVYVRPMKLSWKRVSWWFLAHNIIALAIPLYGYDMAQAVSGTAYHSKHLGQFICYFIFVLTIWLAPIIMAEQIRRREKKFQEHVNNFCPGMLMETADSNQSLTSADDIRLRGNETAEIISTGSNQEVIVGDKIKEYTLATRGKELRNFLRFLKKRTPGLVARGYSFQLNLSLISLLAGIVSFLVRLNNGNESSPRNLNSTLY